MASYTIKGHPLNYTDLAVNGILDQGLKTALQNNGVGTAITLTLAGPDDTKAKGHKVVE